VSACPEQALHVGFGKPAFLAKHRDGAAPTRPYDLSWNEEIVLAFVALASFFALRGAIGVPLLFASGAAACATYLAWITAEVVRRRDVRLHRFQLKREGRVKGAGAAVAAITGVVLAGLAYVGAVNAAVALGDVAMSRVEVPPEVVYSGTGIRAMPAVVRDAERARACYRFALPAPDGIGFEGPWTPVLVGRVAWLDAVAGDYKASETRLRAVAERRGMTEDRAAGIARAMRGGGDLRGAVDFARAQWDAHVEWEALREEIVGWLVADERRDDAMALAREAVARRANDLNAMRRLSVLLVETGDPARVAEGVALVSRTLEIAPDNPFAYKMRADGNLVLGKIDEAESDLRRAMELAPDDWRFMQALGEFLMSHDQMREAMPLIKRATTMRAEQMKR
jgi:tetratricopeptide (TPR) repeat protein